MSLFNTFYWKKSTEQVSLPHAVAQRGQWVTHRSRSHIGLLAAHAARRGESPLAKASARSVRPLNFRSATFSAIATIAAFYDTAAAAVARHLDAGRTVAVIAEGDPRFYGSYMHLHARLTPKYPCEVVAGVTGMSGCWSAAGAFLKKFLRSAP